MSDNDEKLAQFQSITGCDPERAQFYLESANWQIDLAMASFYEGEGDMEVGGDQVPAVAAPPAAAPPAAEPAVPAARGGGIGRINFAAAGSDSDDSDSEQQAFYAGGSSHSGNVILGPKKKKFNVGDMFKAARDSGAEAIDPSEAGAGPSGGVRAFQGGGFKLGSDTAESVQIGGGQEKRAESVHFVLKMWRDGFSLDDGELKKYDDPQNREFLASVMRGSIPPELVKEAKGGEVHVDMEDHREEEFVKLSAKAKPFQGSGNVLGSIAPSVAPPPASPTLDPAQAEKTAQQKLKLDESKPVANIQVRLADGSRLIVKLNHTHSVADLRLYINTARPQYASVQYTLLTTFPNKELTDDTPTIASAGLVGAAVLQRLK
eukprot:GFUD01008795.1.p1 GENE.GFUD01008795.1~~GFUD01008795.1.p1  ORF type:complete len:376 (+),score=147.82 GFUD01008795.1:121-1248(+)